jgi:uncharacterized membrane protein YfcA
MEYWVIGLAALITSGLTLFSGFGLGTLLLPVFALFFPVEVAVALTAIVHFLNNLFKLVLLGRKADKTTVFRFGLPAILAAFLGAYLLLRLGDLEPLYTYQLLSRNLKVMPLKLVVSILMVFFALFELIPRFEKLSFDRKYLPLGGFLSGFFGGLSGHQGALRSAFLLKCGLSKESFIATGVVIACLVDISRISVYSTHFSRAGIAENTLLLFSAVVCAFLGAFIGNRLIKKVTMRAIQVIVSFLLLGIAVALGTGLI